ncbi:MAG: class I SAM-dependent methyltransferase [Anaerolineaceae bacterium]|nr:class I SAM-dependent methyltransferase [Anaerolineaceae bacterium]
MSYFDRPENVKNYINMAEGFDGRNLIKILKDYLHQDASVLELGMGPGKDLDLLKGRYQAIGSDYSRLFLEYYQKKNPNADLLHLDAISLLTERSFDCIYSNKVFHLFPIEKIQQSLKRQYRILNKNGICLHSFWYGNESGEIQGLKYYYYTEKSILTSFFSEFELLEFKRYSEIDENDSFYLLLKKNE